MSRRMILAMFSIIVGSGCMTDKDSVPDEKVGVVEQKIALDTYSASNTGSAMDVSTTTLIPVDFAAGETVMIGTYGITGSSYQGNTYLRLRSALFSELALNDNVCGTLGSRLTYTSPNAAEHVIWAGCFSNLSCGLPNPNVVAISRRKALYSYSASSTNGATVNTFNTQFYFYSGQTVRISTCSAEAAGASVDASPNDNTHLRLWSNEGGTYYLVASNDNAVGSCGCGNASLIKYEVSSSGYYQVRAGCAANTSCNGTVAVYVE